MPPTPLESLVTRWILGANYRAVGSPQPCSIVTSDLVISWDHALGSSGTEQKVRPANGFTPLSWLLSYSHTTPSRYTNRVKYSSKTRTMRRTELYHVAVSPPDNFVEWYLFSHWKWIRLVVNRVKYIDLLSWDDLVPSYYLSPQTTKNTTHFTITREYFQK